MRQSCKRYDAWGNVILPHAEMLLYYKTDKNSLDIVRRYMPHRYVCLPTVEIRISTQDASQVRVYLIYPGETKERIVDTSVRSLEGLRRTWKGKPGWIRSKVENACLVLRREGRVILDPLRKFGIYR